MLESQNPVSSSAARPYARLPRYLHRRGQHYYFKRKIPADLRDLFGDGRKQYWKALGTTLLEKARVLLAVEVSEFEFALAGGKSPKACKTNGHGGRDRPHPGDRPWFTCSRTGSASRHVIAPLTQYRWRCMNSAMFMGRRPWRPSRGSTCVAIETCSLSEGLPGHD